MAILMVMGSSGRGLACAFETSTMMWGRVEVRFGCRPSTIVFCISYFVSMCSTCHGCSAAQMGLLPMVRRAL